MCFLDSVVVGWFDWYVSFCLLMMHRSSRILVTKRWPYSFLNVRIEWSLSHAKFLNYLLFTFYVYGWWFDWTIWFWPRLCLPEFYGFVCEGKVVVVWRNLPYKPLILFLNTKLPFYIVSGNHLNINIFNNLLLRLNLLY